MIATDAEVDTILCMVLLTWESQRKSAGVAFVPQLGNACTLDVPLDVHVQPLKSTTAD